jgi:hypothetical protein
MALIIWASVIIVLIILGVSGWFWDKSMSKMESNAEEILSAPKIVYNEEIALKAVEQKKLKAYKKLCIKALICPNCGASLEKSYYDFDAEGVEIHINCTAKCGFKKRLQ